MFHFFLLILCTFHSGESGTEELDMSVEFCPNCKDIDCLPQLSAKDCPNGYQFHENIVGRGCCPACVKYLDLNEECDFRGSWPLEKILKRTVELECTDLRAFKLEFIEAKNSSWLIPSVHLVECSPEGECKNNKCVVKSASNCKRHWLKYQSWLKTGICSTYEWEPRCTLNGNYDKIQSKSNIYNPGRKFCSDSEGNRIFGRVLDDNQSCECSHKRWELSTNLLGKARDDVTLHCTTSGKYEVLQCDQGRCWCMNSTLVTSPFVPEASITTLPCYENEHVGSSYLRRCESRKMGRLKAESILNRHGHFWRQVFSTDCGYDGSFGLIKCTHKPTFTCHCVDPNGNLIKNYFSTTIESMDCRCARDEYDRATDLTCMNNFGGYKELQSASGDEWCVDKDGFQWSMSVMRVPDPTWTEKRCRVPQCKASEDRCRINQCCDCKECEKCGRNPGDSCFKEEAPDRFKSTLTER